MLKIYTLEEHEQWDKIVSTFEKYDVYWLSGYVRAFQIHGDGVPMLFYFEGNKTRAINVVMKRDIAYDKHFYGKIPVNQYFDFSTPYGYGGWIIEGNDIDTLNEEYETWCQKNEIVSEFIRFHPMVKNHRYGETFYSVSKLGEVVHMELSCKEAIWDNITSKNRNVIRKAIKNGVKIYYGRYPEIYEKFRNIYNETMDKDNAEDYYYFGEEFYRSILEDLPQNAQIFYAEKDGEVIAASIILATNGYMNYHLSGSKKEYSSYAPTNLLLYKAALWGNANGYKTFYLGGGVGSGEDSLFKFKKAFYKGNLNHFYIGKKIFKQETYDKLLSIRDENIQDSFFPLYRA